MVLMIIFIAAFILYLFLIMPRMKNRPDHSALLRHHYAHRGLHDNNSDAPENSMAAFRKAVDAGYGIELDVQLTKDGIPVIFHDATLDRVCGVKGKIKDYSYEELQQFQLCRSQEKIPKLADFLNMVNGKVPLIVEFKYHGNIADTCAAADKLLREYAGVYCIESFHPMVLVWYKKNRPNIIRGQLSTNFFETDKNAKWYYVLMQQLLTNVLTRPDFIAYDRRYKENFSRLLCKKLYGALSVAWTTRSQMELNADKGDFDLFIFENFIPAEK